MLTEDQSAFIPLGAVHRLEIPGKVDLHIIEVQSGPYQCGSAWNVDPTGHSHRLRKYEGVPSCSRRATRR